MGLKDIFKRLDNSPAAKAARLAALMYRRAAQADDEELAESYRRVARAEIDRVIQLHRQ